MAELGPSTRAVRPGRAAIGLAFVVVGVIALIPDVSTDAALVWAVVLGGLGTAGLVATIAALVSGARSHDVD